MFGSAGSRVGRGVRALQGAVMPKVTSLQRSTSQSIAYSTWTLVSWDTVAVLDEVGAFNGAVPTQVIVPSGYSKVRVTAYAVWPNSTNGYRFMQVYKFGGWVNVEAYFAAFEAPRHMTTRWEAVAPGDILKMEVNQVGPGGVMNFSPTGGFGTPAYIQFEWMP